MARIVNIVLGFVHFLLIDLELFAQFPEVSVSKSHRLAPQNLRLDVAAAAKKRIAREGYDPSFGACPLQRAIPEHRLEPLATNLRAGEFKPGDLIKVSAKDGELVFEKKK